MNGNTKKPNGKGNCECYVCGKRIQRAPSKIARSRSKIFTCSRECNSKRIAMNPPKKRFNCRCFICGVELYRQKSELNRLKDKRVTCSRKCFGKKKTIVELENIESKLGVTDFKGWLSSKYYDEKLNTRDIAELVYGKRTHSPNILGWMTKLGLEARERSEAVALQWADNPDRRSEQAEFARVNLSAGTPGRDKLIEVMQSEEYRLKQSITKRGERNGMYGVTGENHPLWNDGLTREDREISRNYPEYMEWRMKVFEKDDFTCQCCFYDKGGYLNAHHLNGHNWDIENRLNPDNGVTLCVPCHAEFHKIYGYGNNTKKQFEMFLNNENPEEYKEQLALL